MTEQLDQYNKNLVRVNGLISLYKPLKKKSNKQGRPSDILRAAVVFLHAAEEDYLRNTLIHWYPSKADREALKEVPLAGTEGRSAKYSFDVLSAFRGITVDELVRDSIKQYFSKISFNSYGDIVSKLGKIKIDLSSFEYGSEIDSLITRRHKIVHEVDLLQRDNKSEDRTRPIKEEQVEGWLERSQCLVKLIDSQVSVWEKETEASNG